MEWKVFDWQSRKVGQVGEVLNRNVYRCGFCKGRKIMFKNNLINCPVCLGKGTVYIPGLAVICASCNGEGRSYLNKELTCSVCKGRGIVLIESQDIMICTVCKGRGRERGNSLPCLKCKGKGVVARREIPVGKEGASYDEEKE